MQGEEQQVNKTMKRLRELDEEIQLLDHTAALLEWDRETYMPEAAVEERSEQLALLEGLRHEMATSADIGELLEAAESGGAAEEVDRAFLREMRRRHERLARIPADLAKRIAREATLAHAKWVKARAAADFAAFAPSLQKLLDLTLEKAERLGYQEERYDPLLDEFEPWMKTREVAEVFAPLQEQLKALLGRICASDRAMEEAPLHRAFDLVKQRRFADEVLAEMGLPAAESRMDLSAHPMTTAVGRSDVRLTNRYHERFISTGIFGCIHEGGHALYELGFAPELRGTLLAGGASMGIHESQSRMWENMIGRSEPFWQCFFPRLQGLFPQSLGDMDERSFYCAVNRVAPSLIRTEADEVTYNLHIVLRFNLERLLFAGKLAVSDLPDAWRAQSRELLGIEPESDDQGVLQDIHWSEAMFGYFPSYCLGNLYAAQLFEAMCRDMPDVPAALGRGRLRDILTWLRENVHRHGRIYPAGELCRRITGKGLTAAPFMEYLNRKFGGIYGF